MNEFHYIWMTLAAVFVIFEIFAVSRQAKDDTFSESVHHFTKKVPFGGHLVAIFMAWLAWHFTLGKGRRWDFWRRQR